MHIRDWIVDGTEKNRTCPLAGCLGFSKSAMRNDKNENAQMKYNTNNELLMVTRLFCRDDNYFLSIFQLTEEIIIINFCA